MLPTSKYGKYTMIKWMTLWEIVLHANSFCMIEPRLNICKFNFFSNIHKFCFDMVTNWLPWQPKIINYNKAIPGKRRNFGEKKNPLKITQVRLRFRFVVFNATISNISVILWRSVLLVDVARENHRPVAIHWQTLSHNVVSSTPCYEWD